MPPGNETSPACSRMPRGLRVITASPAHMGTRTAASRGPAGAAPGSSGDERADRSRAESMPGPGLGGYSKVLTGRGGGGAMAVWYEANPPKEGSGGDAMPRFVARAARMADRCDAVHVTEDVLGYRRAGPIEAGRRILEAAPGVGVTVTMRVRGRGAAEVDGFVAGCAEAGFSGILVVMGDPPRGGGPDSGQVPSAVVSRLSGRAPDLYLSVPARPDYARIGAKLRARPRGFMTQVVRDARQVRDLVAGLPGFRVVPVVLLPSEGNRRAAGFLGIDLDAYRDGFDELVAGALRAAGDVLLTSPGDFEGAYEFLGTL